MNLVIQKIMRHQVLQKLKNELNHLMICLIILKELNKKKLEKLMKMKKRMEIIMKVLKNKIKIFIFLKIFFI